MLNWLKGFRKSEKGQGMVEYGLILALVSIVALGALGGIGESVKGKFEEVVGAVGAVSDGEIEKIDGLVADGYIPISTPDELNNLRKSEAQTFGKGTKWEGTYTSGLDKEYIQVKDINLTEVTNFEPIGTLNNEFKGSFDGGGYVISNLTINRGSEDYIGLFGRAEGATFKNVGLEKVNVKGRHRVGGLVGVQQSDSSVSDSYATGQVSGSGNNVGGLVGVQGGSSTVSNSYATGKVNGVGGVGGLVGLQSSSTVTNSYATGNVSGSNSYVGGLVAYQTSSTVTSSYYDTERTEQSDTGKGEGKTTAEMKNKDTYVDWDFESIWTIESGQYPTLR